MKKSVGREYYETLLIVVIFALFARTFVFGQFKIPSGSMEETLLIGDHLVVNRFLYGGDGDGPVQRLLPYREPARGDIVVFRDPNDPRRDLIKRCVAVGGDTVRVEGDRLFVNGRPEAGDHAVYRQAQRFPDLPGIPEGLRRRDNVGPLVVPDGHVFCMGDNRDNSHDSRFFGPVPDHYLKGRAVMIYWSYEADRSDWQWRGVAHRLKQLAEVAVHFFTRTRWERTFHLTR